MKDEDKSKEQLIIELHELRERVAEFEKGHAERKRMEEELRESEERFKRFFRSTPIATSITRLSDGQIADANDAYLDFYGYSREEVIGQSRLKLGMWANPDDQTKIVEILQEQGWIRDFETQFRVKSGEIKDVLVSAELVEVAGEQYILGLGDDITERKRIEQELRKSEELYRTLVNLSPDAISMADLNGLLIFSSPKAMQMFGDSPDDEILGRSILSRVAPEDQNKTATNIKQLFTEGTLTDSEYTLIRKDGTRFIGEVSAAVIRSPDGTSTSMIIITRDVTERKRAQDELFNSRQMLRTVLDNIPQRVFWKDRNSIFVGCNKPFALDCGYEDPGELVGKTSYETASAGIADLYSADDREVMESSRPKINYEEPQIRPDGSRAWLITNKVPMYGQDGHMIGVLGTYEDITERKYLEEELRKSRDELELRVKERTVALEKANNELRQVPSKLIAVQEEERKSLASELHDSIGQTLAAVKFWVEMALKLRDSGDGNAALNHLDQFVPILQHSIEETRSIYMGLRPSMLDSAGLLATLEWLRHECMKLYPERHIEVEVGIAEEEIPENLRVNIFRIAQEALNNIAKHSKSGVG